MIEYRTAKGGAEANGDLVTGLVTPFGVETAIGDLKNGGFREEVAPGAFKKTLQERDIVFLWNHDTGKPLARTSVPEGEGSLALREAAEGLRADSQPVATSYGQDLLKLTRSGVVAGMSFGFEVLKDSWTDDEGRASNAQVGTKRTIQEVRLHEVSAVTFPAYTSTTFNARDVINAARGVEAARAAKATYADIETCGECGSTNEYGSYCSACGQPMSQNSGPSGDFCTSCGSELDDSSRASHSCTPETRTVSAEIDACLDEAFAGINSVDRDALPSEVNQFIDLASAALKLASADLQESGTPDPDNPNGNSYDGAGSTTPDEDERADLALLATQFKLERDI